MTNGKAILLVIITSLVVGGVTYSATILSTRFLDMQAKVESANLCQAEIVRAMPKVGGK